ncbi:MAG: Rid family hydrolase [Gemmatimonadota bacterium]|nr:Rid family hydrolase [Gemmatimonadota bacterium]
MRFLAKTAGMILFILAAAGPVALLGQDLRVEYVNHPAEAALGLPFSSVVRVGDMLYLSGMVGVSALDSMELVPGGMPAEARQALENIEAILAYVGAGREDIVKCTVMLDDIGRWSEFNEVYVEFFGSHRPARSAFGADGLALGAAVEIECMAVAP